MTWPPIFDGIGAMFVRTDNDPAVQIARIQPTPTWVAVKVNGSDIEPRPDIISWIERAHAAYPAVALGVWVYNFGPPSADIASWQLFYKPPFVIYDVESPYKADEGGHYEWAAQLVAMHPATVTAAVTSYGAYKTSLDFGAFASAGWPILAQCYDPFHFGDESTYEAVYPPEGIHAMLRQLSLSPGEAVYRPEGIDG